MKRQMLALFTALAIIPTIVYAQGIQKPMGPAGSGKSGYVSATTQTFSGVKTFEASVTFSADGFNFSAQGTVSAGCGTAYGQGRVLMVNGSGATKTKLCLCTFTPTGSVFAWQDMATGTVGTTTTC